MAWFVHYWDEINNRNICSSEISAREDAMRKACSLIPTRGDFDLLGIPKSAAK